MISIIIININIVFLSTFFITLFFVFQKCLYDLYQVPPRNLSYVKVVKSSLKFIVYTKPSNSKPGTMYGRIKGRKENNPARVITSGCGTAVEFLFLLKIIYIKRLTK